MRSAAPVPSASWGKKREAEFADVVPGGRVAPRQWEAWAGAWAGERSRHGADYRLTRRVLRAENAAAVGSEAPFPVWSLVYDRATFGTCLIAWRKKRGSNSEKSRVVVSGLRRGEYTGNGMGWPFF